MQNLDWPSALQSVWDPVDSDFIVAAEEPMTDGTHSADLDFPTYQLPTTPLSEVEKSLDCPPIAELRDIDGDTVLAVSTAFFPGAHDKSSPADVILLSSDSIFFYVQPHILLDASENGFKAILYTLPTKDNDQFGPMSAVPESSAVLNIVLHTIYNMSCTRYSPSFDALCSAVDALEAYGVTLKSRIASTLPLYTLLISHAPLHPLELYALASFHDLYDLAVSTSSHLLSFRLDSLTDEMAERIGPIYLKRLFFLHLGRVDALKRLLLSPPIRTPLLRVVILNIRKS